MAQRKQPGVEAGRFGRRNRCVSVARAPRFRSSSPLARSNRALIIGVRVKETSKLTSTATAAVRPNWYRKRPEMLDMKETGTKMTTRLKVVAMTARPDLRRGGPRGLKRPHLLLLDEAEDVLQHDDGVVDDNAHHQHQGEHGHAVEGEVERLHHAEGGDDGSGDGDRGDDHGAPVAHEQQHHQAGQNAAREPGGA